MPTGKTKPLGPRQRLAYVKPFRAAFETAKKELAEKRAALEAAKAIEAKGRKRFALPAIRTDAGGGRHEVITGPGAEVWHLRSDITKMSPKARRTFRAELIEGKTAVTFGTGSPRLPNAVKRIRKMTRADVAKRARLLARLSAAQQAVEAHVLEAWARAVPYTVAEMADAIIGLAASTAPYVWVDEFVVTRAEAELAEAQKHDGTKTCPCRRCVRERDDAARQARYAAENKAREKAEAKRLAKLGTRDFTCPHCGEANTAAQIDLDENDGEPFVECAVCEMGTLIVDLTEADKVTAASPGQVALAIAEVDAALAKSAEQATPMVN